MIKTNQDLINALKEQPPNAKLRFRVYEGEGFGDWSHDPNRISITKYDRPTNILLLTVHQNYVTMLPEEEEVFYGEEHHDSLD